jgi:hypothetical protein
VNKQDLAKAKAEHNKFLKKMGCLPEQIRERKGKKKKPTLGYEGTAAAYFDKKELQDVLQGDADTATKRDIISNLYKASPADKKRVIEMSTRVGVLVNKSGYGVITPGTDPKTLGRK